LDIEAESESSTNRLFAGLGVTREVLTGEGSYSGSRISLDIMNNLFMSFREVIVDYVENNLFKPIARKKGFIEYDEYGNEVLLYPKLSFTRLAIRDNEQYFDAAFQMYQRGSLSSDFVLDVLNIDPDITKEKLEQDMMTVNDSTFNEVLRNTYTAAGAAIVEQTDVVKKLADYMKLAVTPQEPGKGGESRFSSSDRVMKLAKIMKYLEAHPEALDRVFAKSKEIQS